MDADQRARLISQGIDPDTYVEPTPEPTAAHVQTLTDAIASLQQLIQPTVAPVAAPAPVVITETVTPTEDIASYRPVDQVYAPPAPVVAPPVVFYDTPVPQSVAPSQVPAFAPYQEFKPLVDNRPAPEDETTVFPPPTYYALETPYPVKPAEAPVAPEVSIGDNTPSPFPLATNAVETPAALDTMVGGTHYTDMAFQPLQFILANHLGFVEGNVIKYVCRWQAKGGIEDLKKAQDYLSKLVAHEEAARP